MAETAVSRFDAPWLFAVEWDPSEGALPHAIMRLFRHRSTIQPGSCVHRTDKGHATYYVTAVETFVRKYHPDRTDIKATATEVTSDDD